MRQIPLGPGHSPSVSVIGYGGMHLSIAERPAEALAIRVIHAALDAGMTLIDTADAYCLDASEIGHNERLIARALKQWPGPRERILVATKGGITRDSGRWIPNGRPDHLRRACEASLNALGVECIALYQFHAPDVAVPFEESIAALAELKRQGKIERIGLSNVSVHQIEQASRIAPIATVQNRLNPFFREALTDGVVQHCAEQRLGFLAYSPTGGGRLTRKLPDHPVLAALARELGVTPHAICLAWVLGQGRSVIAIPSARRPEHAIDSAHAGDLILSPAAMGAISDAEFDRR